MATPIGVSSDTDTEADCEHTTSTGRTNQAVDQGNSVGVFSPSATSASNEVANQPLLGINHLAPVSAAPPIVAAQGETAVGSFTLYERTNQSVEQCNNFGLFSPRVTTRANPVIDQLPEVAVLTTSAPSKTVSVKCKVEDLLALVTVGNDPPTEQAIILEPLDGLAISGKPRSNGKYVVEYGKEFLAV